ncbi:MAG: peptidyl-prolyl cis-trans isomerase C, partial [Thalassolituus oleivorans]
MTTVALHHILLKSPLLAQDIINELAIGASFEDLASNHSACP